MATITITVSGTPPTGTYTKTSSSGDISVDSSGKITVNERGNTNMTFNRGGSETWKFTGVTIDPSAGSVTQNGQTQDDQIKLSDNDTADGDYEYTLNTDAGDFDPQILNRGPS